jgi:magnesium transporter
MLQIYYKGVSNHKIKEQTDIKKGSWIHCTNPTNEDISLLQRHVSINEADILDALDSFEIPRIEKKKDATVLYLRAPDYINADGYTVSETLSVILSTEFTVTISSPTSKVINQLKENYSNFSTTQQSKFLFFILKLLAKDYTRQLLILNNKVQEKFRSLKRVESTDITQLLVYDQLINLHLSVLNPLTRIIEILMQGTMVKLYAEDAEFLDDVLTDIRQALTMGEVTKKLIVSTRDSYQIIFTNELNKKVQFLAGVTIVLTIPTGIASLWGMNVTVPFAEHPYAFISILGGALLFSIIVFAILLWRRWI